MATLIDATFDLLEQPWLPCVERGSPRPRDMSLREALLRAHELVELVDPSPLVTVALHRLLLAVVHRVFGPATRDAWAELWDAGALPAAPLEQYFDQVRERFDLFDAERPFYQDARLKPEYARSVATLTHELASGNNATLFDHTTEVAGVELTAARAARQLVAFQAFTVGGLVSLEKGQNPSEFKSAKAAPLARGAVALLRGQTLWETLLLNLVRYACASGEPAPCRDDQPAWERAAPPEAGDRVPAGYLDYLTWQSRRVRLLPEAGDGEALCVRQVVIMKGAQLPENVHRQGYETMLAFRKNEQAKPNQDPWPTVDFQPDRALWRDSLALFGAASAGGARPRTLDWVARLAQRNLVTSRVVGSVDALGMAADRAKVLLWRHERLPLPLEYLNNKELVDALRQALVYAEETGKAVRTSAWLAASLELAPDSDAKGGRQPDRQAVERLRDSLAPLPPYWARLEPAFRRLLVDLPGDRAEEDGQPRYGHERVLPVWRETLRQAAQDALEKALQGLRANGRSQKAVACAERELARGLAAALGPANGAMGTERKEAA